MPHCWVISGVIQTLQEGPKPNTLGSISVIDRTRWQRSVADRGSSIRDTLIDGPLSSPWSSHQRQRSRDENMRTDLRDPWSVTTQPRGCDRRPPQHLGFMYERTHNRTTIAIAPHPSHRTITTNLSLATTVSTCANCYHVHDRDPTRLPAAVRQIWTGRIDVAGATPVAMIAAISRTPPSGDDHLFGTPQRRRRPPRRR